MVDGPFTAGVFFGDGPLTAIREDFSKFGDPSAYKLQPLPSGASAPTLPVYGAMLNHEWGPYWLSEGLRHVIDLYQTRAANFREAMKADRVLFAMDRRYSANTAALLSELERVREGAPFRLFMLRTDGGSDDEGTQDPRVIQARIDRPGGGYVWWNADSYNSQQGLDYEGLIADVLVNTLEAMSDD